MKRKWGLFSICILMLAMFTAGCGNSAATEGSGKAEEKEEYVIKFAHVVSASTAKGKAAEKFKELLEERTDGQIKVEVFPDSQLGADREITEQMQSGTIQMNAPFTGVLPAFVKQFEVFDLPYLFKDREHVKSAVNGKVGEIFNQHLEKQGLRALGYWDGGFKHLTNSKHTIQKPDDLDGLKMRVSQSPLLISQFQAMGAGGVSIDFAELYTALQTKTVDGQENPLSNIVSKKFYEVQDYLTLSSHGYMAYPLLMSEQFYQKLPADLQKAVDEVSAEVTDWQWEQSAADEEAYMKTLKESGIEITELTESDKEAFIEATSEVYEDFKKVEGGQEVLDAIKEVQ
ncbi:C4-dicarboxylate-binding protein DctP [Cytobacillus firmus]|uniref:C4-dicarboxylate-binding protein DctP n=2 Tax=Cytobacillus TaxID=2675230 RepID=A0A366K437_CYTFI|nr:MULTISPECIES: TRAP transporter substrate-binding protein [Cytobacillus]RBP96072.1 C4-dicarboxylate-binding protein DctP [Cytobacillus firmus]TDX44985.1 C4-dicarboxylate-binding protein DctP [Cytobacillus oceanisediminis]